MKRAAPPTTDGHETVLDAQLETGWFTRLAARSFGYQRYAAVPAALADRITVLWQNATDGAWILVPREPCSDCRGPFYHRFFTKEGCQGALAEWNDAINEQRVRQATGPISLYRIGVLGNCEAHPLRP